MVIGIEKKFIKKNYSYGNIYTFKSIIWINYIFKEQL